MVLSFGLLIVFVGLILIVSLYIGYIEGGRIFLMFFVCFFSIGLTMYGMILFVFLILIVLLIWMLWLWI